MVTVTASSLDLVTGTHVASFWPCGSAGPRRASSATVKMTCTVAIAPSSRRSPRPALLRDTFQRAAGRVTSARSGQQPRDDARDERGEEAEGKHRPAHRHHSARGIAWPPML